LDAPVRGSGTWGADGSILIGGESRGILRTAELSELAERAVGKEIDVVLLEEPGCPARRDIFVTRSLECWLRSWDRFTSQHAVGEVIAAHVVGRYGWDVVVDIGFLVGMNIDHVDFRALGASHDRKKIVGQTIECQIVRIYPCERQLLLNHAHLLAKRQAAFWLDRVETLDVREGRTLKGIIKNLVNFGAFVDLGGIEALLHISDMSWQSIESCEGVVERGQEVTVKVLKVDRGGRRICVGLKQLDVPSYPSVPPGLE